MTEPFLVPYDPNALERRAAAMRSALEPVDDEDEDAHTERALGWMRVAIAMLPPLEQTLITEHLSGKSFRVLGLMTGLTKPAVRKRVRRARERLLWLAMWPGLELTIPRVEEVCARHLSRRSRAIVLAYWPRAGGRMLTQAEVGARYGITQSAVQLRLIGATDVLTARAEQGDDDAAPVASALVMLVATSSSFVLRDDRARGARRRRSLAARTAARD